MKEIVDEYGEAIVAVVAAIGIFGLLVHLLTVPFRAMTIDHTDRLYSAQVYKTVMEKKKPEFKINNPIAGDKYQVEDIVSARDMDGNLAQLDLYKIESINGDDVTSEVMSNQGELSFSESGYFKLYVNAVDCDGRGDTEWIYIYAENA